MRRFHAVKRDAPSSPRPVTTTAVENECHVAVLFFAGSSRHAPCCCRDAARHVAFRDGREETVFSAFFLPPPPLHGTQRQRITVMHACAGVLPRVGWRHVAQMFAGKVAARSIESTANASMAKAQCCRLWDQAGVVQVGRNANRTGHTKKACSVVVWRHPTVLLPP